MYDIVPTSQEWKIKSMSQFQIKKVQESCPEKAYLYGLRVLGRREYSESELRKKMKLKGFEKDHIDSSINQLAEKNFINLDRYTEYKIRSLIQKSYSISMIQSTLENEDIKVDQEFIESIFEREGVSETDLIYKILMRKKPDHSWLQPKDDRVYKLKQKAMVSAQQKGHNYRKVQEVLSAILHHLDDSQI